jgi:hypothetical protein
MRRNVHNAFFITLPMPHMNGQFLEVEVFVLQITQLACSKASIKHRLKHREVFYVACRIENAVDFILREVVRDCIMTSQYNVFVFFSMHSIEVSNCKTMKVDSSWCQLSIQQAFTKCVGLLDGWVWIFGEFQEARYEFLPADNTVLGIAAPPEISFISVQYNSEIFLRNMPSHTITSPLHFVLRGWMAVFIILSALLDWF